MTIPGDIVLPENPPTRPSPRTPLTLSTADEGPYGKQLDERAQTQQSNLQQSTFVAGQRNDPARWAKVLDLSKRLKVNPSFVDQNYETLTKTDAENKITSQAGNSPTLAEWLQNPDNATISKDELPALSKVDQGVRALVPPVPIAADASVVGTIPRAPLETPYQAGFQSVAGEKPRDWKMDLPHAALTGYNDTRAAAGQLAVAYGMVAPEHAAEWVAAVNKRSAELRAQEPLYAKEYSASMAEHRQAIDLTVRGAPAFGRGKVLDALKGYAKGNVKTVGELLGMLGSAIMNPAGFVYSTVESLPGMAPALVGGAGGAAVGGLPGLIGGTFIGMAPLNVGSEINAEMAKRGYDITKPDDLRRAYSDPALMAEIRGRAARAGVTSAAVSSLVASFAGGLTARAEASGAGAAGRVVATAGDVAVQAGGQGVAQLAGQVAGEKGDLSKVSLGAAAETAISMLGYGIGETVIGASRRGLFRADPVEAATQATTQASEALKVVHDAQALAQIGVALKEAPVTSTVPDRVKSLIETATGGDPAHAVYFQEVDWNSYWQSKGESPAKAAADIMGDGGKAYDEARTTGAPLAIPLGDYISKVATTDHFEGLLNVARTEPGGMSLGEAHEYLQGLPATLGDIAKEAENAPETPKGTTIAQNIEQQLITAGRTPAEAKAMGAVYESAFTTLGRRAGIDPQLLFDRYRLGVRGPEQIARAEEAARIAAQASKVIPAVSDEFEAKVAQETLGDAAAAQLVRPRTKTGRLKNLSKATPEELANEYRILIDANASENVAPTSIDDNAGRMWQGIKPAAMKAMGRVAARAKSIAKIEAELAKRGIEPSDAYMQAASLERNIEPTAFDFNQAPPPSTTGERRSLTAENAAARAAFDRVAGEIHAFPEERRQLLVQALKAFPDMLDLKQVAGAGDEARGRFRISAASRQAMIDLFKPADRSTFLHESGHLYLEVLGDLATGENASPEISKDYSTILQWLGKENRSQLTTAEHEQFARGFEAYLMEGKAPSSALREAFFRFKNWLTRIYKEVGNLNANISPEVRAVFDRILASDEEIRQAQAEQVTTPLFDDPRSVGMTDEQAQQFSQAVNEANQAASEELTTKMMRELRREESKDWKVLKDTMRSAVEAEAEKNPVLRALSLLTRGKTPLGNELSEGLQPFKLSRQAIVDDFGKARLESLPRPYVYSAEGGVHPDAAAEALGFKSGDELLTALSNSQKPSDWIAQETNRRMQAEHGERLSDLQIRQAAATAVRGQKQVQILRKTLEILASDQTRTFLKLAEKINGAVPPTEELRVQADKIIGEKSVKDIRPILYERAAAAQAKLAQELFRKGDIQGAFDAKRKELLATEVLRSAEDAKSQVQEGLNEFKKMIHTSDEKLAKSRDMDLVNTIRSVLAEFGLGSSKKTPDAYMEQLRQYDPEMARTMANLAATLAENPMNYKDMSYDEFNFLRDGIKGIWNEAREVMTTTVDGVKVDRITVRNEIIARAEEIRKPGALPGQKKALTDVQRFGRAILSFKDAARRVEHWTRAFDGGDPLGVFRKYVWNRISEPADNFRVAKTKTAVEYAEFLKGLKDLKISRRKMPAPEIDYTFSGHNELLGALLHTGNESNLTKLLIGRGWGKMEEHTIGPNKTAAILDTSRWDALTKRLRAEGTLTKEHYDFVQGVWDRFEALKPDAQRAHKQMFGRYFAEITHNQFSNEFGTYKGGYYPAKTDPYMVSDAAARADREALLGDNGSEMFPPSVARGFTKERNESYRKPLVMDASAIPQHFDAVLRFTHLGPAVRDVARILMDPALRASIDALDPVIMHDVMRPWLERAAQQVSESQGGKSWFAGTVNKVARAVRNNAALQIMAFNPTVTLEQLTHFPSVFVRVKPRHVADAMWAYMSDHKQMAEEIAAESPMMASRESAALTEAKAQSQKILLDPSVFDTVRSASLTHGRFIMAAIQGVMDHVVYIAAKAQAIEAGMEPRDAIREAASTVREVLGSYNPEDISTIEAGTAIGRLMITMFYGFWNTKANILATETTIAQQVGLKKGTGRLTNAYFWGAMIPFFTGYAIKQAMGNKPFADDEEGTAHALLRHFGLSQIEGLGRMVPGVGPALTTIEAAFGHGRAGSLLDSPALKLIGDAVVGSGKAVRDISSGEEITSKDISDVFTLIGLVTGIPLRPLARPIGYIHDVKTGKAEPASLADFGRGLLVGR